MPQKTQNPSSRLQPKRVAARYSAFLLIVCGLLGYELSLHAYTDPYRPWTPTNYTVQNWGLALIVGSAFFAYVLKRLQGGVYWLAWLQLQKTNPDERQQAVRRRVFERAYAVAVFFLFVAAPSAMVTLAQYAAPSRNDLILRSSWVIGIFFISLPSILAAWQKDS